MKTKILLSLISLIVAVSLVAGGTFAYFIDTGSSTANTFSSGTLDMKIANDNTYSDDVTTTWSKANFAPNEKVSGTLHFTNSGSINANHVYFNFSAAAASNVDLMKAIHVTKIVEVFKNTTTNTTTSVDIDLSGLEASMGGAANQDHIITMDELTKIGFYTWDDRSGDNILLAAGNELDYSIQFDFEFYDANGTLETPKSLQGQFCGLNVALKATQSTPTEGYVSLH